MPQFDESIEPSTQDELDLAKLHALPGGELPEPTWHSVLEVWRESLRPAADEATKPITPKWASKIVSTYQGVGFADMVYFRDQYFAKIQLMLQILLDEIDTDDECLKITSPEEDVAANSQHYRNVIQAWNLELHSWELDWDTTSPHAAVDIAVITEVYHMFFGPMSLTNYLDNIKFEFTEADQEALRQALVDQGGER